jgi:hypothetical protein
MKKKVTQLFRISNFSFGTIFKFQILSDRIGSNNTLSIHIHIHIFLDAERILHSISDVGNGAKSNRIIFGLPYAHG